MASRRTKSASPSQPGGPPSGATPDALGLRLLTDQLPIFAWSTDRELRLASITGAVLRQFGLDPAQLVGGDLLSIVSEPETVRTGCVRALAGDSVSFRTQRGDRHVQSWVEPFRDAQGAIVGVLGMSIDITERTQAQQRIAESEALFRATFEQAAVGMVLCDQDGRFLRANEKFCRLVGYSVEDLLATDYPALTHPEDRAADREQHQALLAGRIETYARDKRYLRKDGSTVWVQVTASVRRMEGQPVQTLAVVQDIGPRITSVRELEAERNFANTVFDGTPALLVVLDPQGRIVRCNTACAQAMGYTVQEIVGQTPWELFLVGAAERAEVAERYRSMPGLTVTEAEARFSRHTERDWRTKTGAMRRIAWTMNYTAGPDGRVQFVIASGLDITERKRAELDLQLKDQIVQNMWAGTALARLSDGSIIHTNPKFAEMFGYEPDELVGQNAAILNAGSPEAAAALAEEVVEAIRSQGIWRGEILNRRKDGTEFWSRSSVVVFDHPEQGLVGLGLHEDITATKAAEDALAENELRLAEAQRIAHLGSWVWEPATDRLRWSDETSRILGLEPGSVEPTMERFVSMIHPEDREHVLTRQAAVRDGDDATLMEYRIVRPDGTVRHIQAQGEEFKDAQGRTIRAVGAVLDVTERKQVERALAENERRLSDAQRIAHLGSWSWDLASGALTWSDETFRVFGLEPAGRTPTYAEFLERVHPADREAVQQAVQTALDEKSHYRWEHRVVWPDGSVHCLLEEGEVQRDAAGRPTGMVGAVLDITARKQNEHDLAENEARLEEAQRIAHLGSWTWDIASGALTWSDEIYRIFGFEPEAMAPTYEGFLASIHPEDRDSVQEAVGAAVAGERPYWVEHRVVRPDGEVRWVLEQGEVTRDAAGQPLSMVGAVLDITEREQARRDLEAERVFSAAVFHSTPALVIVHDKQGRVVRLNRAAAAVGGYEPDELAGRYVWDTLIATPEEQQAVRERYAALATITCKEALERFGAASERTWRTKDGRERRIAWSLAYLPDEQGMVAYQIASGLDITESRAAEAALRESRARYERAVQGSNDGIWDWNLQTNEDYFSPRWLDMLGYGLNDLAPHADTFFDLLHPDDRESAAEAARGHLEDHAPFDTEFRLRRKDGDFLWVRSRGQAVRDEAGVPTRMAGSITDITAERRAAAEIRQLNASLEHRVQARTAELADERNFIATVLDTQDALVLVLDHTGAIVRFNRACERVTGYTQAETLGRKVWDFLIPTEQVEGVARVFATLTAGAFPNQHQNPWLTRTGTAVQIAWNNNAIVDAQGAVTYVIATGIDITERHASEIALRESEERFRVLAEASPLGIFRSAADGACHWVNRAYCGILGRPAEDLLGFGWASANHPDDIERIRDTVASAIARNAPADLEYRILRPDGEVRWVHGISSTYLDGAGQPWHVGVLEDITERKQAEAALRERTAELATAHDRLDLVLSGSTAVTYLAGIGGCAYVSRNVSQLLGYEPEELMGNPGFMHQSVHPEDLERVVAGLGRLPAEGRIAHEYRMRHKDGRYRWVRDDLRLVDGRSDAQVQGVWLDVTERVEAEQRVARMQEQLAVQQKLATVGQLTATVSHELRNPLGTIRTSVFTLRERLVQEAPAHLRTLDRIERNVLRCDNIITDLLDFSRTRAAHPEPTPVADWLRGLVEEQPRPVWLRLEYDLTLGDTVLLLDQDRFRRAVINVVENAIQAIEQQQVGHEPPSGRLTIRGYQEDGRLVVAVRDSGPGMTPEVLERIFEPLYSTKVYGVGLGMPTVKQIMEQESGGIEIASDPGRGTEVRLWMPLTGRIQGVASNA